MKTSETIGKVAAALARAQGKFRRIRKTEHDDVGDFDFAPLSDILEAVRRPLSDAGLALLTPARVVLDQNPRALSTCLLIHGDSGELMESDEFEIPIYKAMDPHEIASAATFARRCAVLAFLGIHPAEKVRAAVAEASEPKPREKVNGATHREPARGPDPQPEPARAAEPPREPRVELEPHEAQDRANALAAKTAQAQFEADQADAAFSDLCDEAEAAGMLLADLKPLCEALVGHALEGKPWHHAVPRAQWPRVREEIAARRDLEGQPPAAAPPPLTAAEAPPVVPAAPAEASPASEQEVSTGAVEAESPPDPVQKPRRRRRAESEDLPLRHLIEAEDGTLVPSPAP